VPDVVGDWGAGNSPPTSSFPAFSQGHRVAYQPLNLTLEERFEYLTADGVPVTIRLMPDVLLVPVQVVNIVSANHPRPGDVTADQTDVERTHYQLALWDRVEDFNGSTSFPVQGAARNTELVFGLSDSSSRVLVSTRRFRQPEPVSQHCAGRRPRGY